MGVFGGTFDPPHVGHVGVATDVADSLDLDRVLWIPAGDPPHKPSRKISAARSRAEMVAAAVRADRRFELSTLELDRPGPSYTVDTLRELRRAHPGAELFLLLGADQARALDRWHEPLEVRRLAHLALMDRAGDSAAALAGSLPGGGGEVVVVAVRRFDVSSTEVRVRAARGEGLDELVPGAVRAIIDRERLYSAP